MSKAFNLPTEAQALHLGNAMAAACMRRAAETIQDQLAEDPAQVPLVAHNIFGLALLRSQDLEAHPPASRSIYEFEWYRIASAIGAVVAMLGDADTGFHRCMRGSAEDLEAFARLPDSWGGLLQGKGAKS